MASSTPTASATVQQFEPGANPLEEWPLVARNYWAYEVQAYDSEITATITATFRITDTVVANSVEEGLFVAQVNRQETLIAGDPDVEMRWFAAPERWYLMDGSAVYKLFEGQFSQPETSFLDYLFPLDGSCWYPYYEQRSSADPDQCNKFGSAISGVSTPAGSFENCVAVIERYISGSVATTFCSGIGVVAEDYDHVGTPFGYHAQLLEYSVSNQP